MRKKVVVFSNYPVGYRIDLFNKLVENEQNTLFKFVFVSDKYEHKRLISSYKDESFINNSVFINNKNSIFQNLKVLFSLLQYKPTHIISAGFTKYSASLCVYKILFYKVQLIIWWGGVNTFKKNLACQIKKYILKLYNAGIYYSKFSKEDLNKYEPNFNINEIIGNNTRNPDLIKKQKINYFKRDNNKFHLMTVGFQENRKNTIILLEAVFLLSEYKNNIIVDVVGDGPELEKLKKFSYTNNLNVIFHGHLNFSKIESLLLNTDLFIHPSKKDQWPQVYNEAISAEVPIIISRESNVWDLYIERNMDLVLFNALDSIELSKKIESLINSPFLMSHLKNETRLNYEMFNYETAFQKIISIIN